MAVGSFEEFVGSLRKIEEGTPSSTEDPTLVTLDGELLFSKAALKRHPRPGEVYRLVAARLGPPLVRDEFHQA